MHQKLENALAYQRGLFRYTVIESLLSSPANPGELAGRLREISEKTHLQPWNKLPIKISIRTLERWYAQSRKAERPPEALQPKLRSDRSQTRALSIVHKKWLAEFYLKFPSWSVQLLFDNLCAANLSSDNPSYSTVLRYFKAQGFFVRSSRLKHRNKKEIRSYEVEYVGQLWHMMGAPSLSQRITNDSQQQRRIRTANLYGYCG